MPDDIPDHHLLELRRYTPPRHGFEQRILATARQVTQRKEPRLRDILNLIFGDLAAPRLQLAYALMLTLGLALGLSAPMQQQNHSAVQTYLNDDGANL